jgi:hypothetical protein
MSGVQVVTAWAMGDALVFGLALGLLASLKQSLAQRHDLTEGRLSKLLPVLNFTLIPLLLLAGALVDRAGVQPMMIAGSVLLALALLALGARLTLGRAVAAVLAGAAGAATLGVAGLVLMPRAFFGVRQASASLNVGMVFMALGALLSRPLFEVLFRSLGPRRALAILAFLCLVPAFLGALPASLPPEPTQAPAGPGVLFGDLSLWLAALVVFLYVPLEASVSLWVTVHAAEQGEERRAGRLLLGFWALFLASRLLVGLVEQAGFMGDEWSEWLVVPPALLAAVFLGNLSAATQHQNVRAGLLGLGLVLGPIFPTLLSMVFHLPSVEKAQAPATAFGVLFAAGSIGSLVLAPLLGACLDKGKGPTVQRLPMFLALLLMVTALMFGLVSGRAF